MSKGLGDSYYYYGTYEKIICVFGLLFKNMTYLDGHNKLIKVPLFYAPEAKFYQSYNNERDEDVYKVESIFPRMGFFSPSVNYAPERMLLGNQQIFSSKTNDKNKYMFNRVPYDIQFELHIATKLKTDLLKIIEQIFPFFKPSLNVTINDIDEFNLKTDITFNLNSVNIDDTFEGVMASRQYHSCDMTFTAQAYFYAPVNEESAIKKAQVFIGGLSGDEFKDEFAKITSLVDPFSANKSDPHKIITTIDDYTNN